MLREHVHSKGQRHMRGQINGASEVSEASDVADEESEWQVDALELALEPDHAAGTNLRFARAVHGRAHRSEFRCGVHCEQHCLVLEAMCRPHHNGTKRK